MLIVAGTFKVAPEDRAAFIERRIDVMARSRAENGCLTYSFMADPIEADTIQLFECWESQEALDAHTLIVRAPNPEPSTEPAIEIRERSILVYPVVPEGPRPL